MAERNESYPVRPHIVDPEIHRDMGPAKIASPAHGAGQAPPSFFQSHKFALIVSAIVLCIFLVIMVVHITRKGSRKKKKIELPAGAEAAELEEMKKLQALRKQRGKADRENASEAPGAVPEPEARAEGKKEFTRPAAAAGPRTKPPQGKPAARSGVPAGPTQKPSQPPGALGGKALRDQALPPSHATQGATSEPLEEGLEGLIDSLRDEDSAQRSQRPEKHEVPKIESPASSSSQARGE